MALTCQILSQFEFSISSYENIAIDYRVHKFLMEEWMEDMSYFTDIFKTTNVYKWVKLSPVLVVKDMHKVNQLDKY